MRFFLGTHQPNHLRTSDVPLFVSARRLRDYKKPPVSACDWALDSGGFTELSKYGRWETPAAKYAEEATEWFAKVGRMQ